MPVTISQPAVLATVLVAFTATLLASAGPVNNCPWGKCEEVEDDGENPVTFMNLLQIHAQSEKGAGQPVMSAMMNIRAPAKQRDRSVKTLHPYYHTGEEVRAKAEALSKDCGGALKLETVSDSETKTSIDVVNIRKPGSSPVNKVFILFGEHARELISPESAVRLMEVICGKAKVDGNEDLASNVLLDSEFQLVLNGNPGSRAKVESGDYCLRANPNGVDLNRNWDEKWEGGQDMMDQTGGGSKPFSEPETRIFKRLVSEFKPTTFLTVHSGTKGMYIPWAYDMKHLAKYNAPLMLEVLKDLDKNHCQCPFGAAGKEVGYPCPGTCLDWVYEKLRTPYVFAFEIYTGHQMDASLKDRWEELSKKAETSLLQTTNHLGHEHFAELFKSHTSDFVQRRHRDKMDLEDQIKKMKHQQEVDRANEMCFSMFNPETETDYNQTVQNWAVTYLEMAQKVAADIKSKRIHL